MSTDFRFWRRRSRLLAGAPALLPPAAEAPLQLPMASTSIDQPLAVTGGAPANSMASLLQILRTYLPKPDLALPPPSVAVVSLTQRAVGLGGWRGNAARAPFPDIALKGSRLDVVVRFLLWAAEPASVDTAVANLQGALLDSGADLRKQHVLSLSARESPVAEQIGPLNAWRRAAEYQILYEYQYEDREGASSLIAEIPIHVQGTFTGDTVVSDEMARWDYMSATTLNVGPATHSPFSIHGLWIMAFLPAGWDGVGVTLTASTGGAVQMHPFTSVRALLNAFTLDPGTIDLGGNPYQAGYLIFPALGFPDPVTLTGGGDFFHVEYAEAAFTHTPAFDLNSTAVVYLRVLS